MWVSVPLVLCHSARLPCAQGFCATCVTRYILSVSITLCVCLAPTKVVLTHTHTHPLGSCTLLCLQLLWEKLRLKATPLPEKQEKIQKFLDLMKGKVCVRLVHSSMRVCLCTPPSRSVCIG